jgi:hypothetical protein
MATLITKERGFLGIAMRCLWVRRTEVGKFRCLAKEETVQQDLSCSTAGAIYIHLISSLCRITIGVRLSPRGAKPKTNGVNVLCYFLTRKDLS